MCERFIVHHHVAKYDDDNKLTDECGFCGLDLRNDVHERLPNDG